MISFSGAEAVVECPSSGALPHVNDTGTAASSAGDARHLFTSRVDELGVNGALALVPAEHRKMCAEIDLAQLPLGPGYETEVAYAFDHTTGKARRLGRLLNRRYEVTPTETPGTADVVSTQEKSRAQGFVEVDDYKGPHAYVTPAARNWQLRMLAVCACQVQGVPRARVRLGRMLESGDTEWTEAWLEAFDLDAAELEFRAAMRVVEESKLRLAGGGKLDLREGMHCVDCPAFKTCPATGTLIMAMAMRPAVVAGDIRELLEVDRARALHQYKRAQAALTAASDAIRASAVSMPIDLGDGTEYGQRIGSQEILDGKVTHQVLEELHGRQVADAACDYKTSKSKVSTEMEKLAQKRGDLKRLNEQVLAEVRKRNGVTPRETKAVDVRKKRAPALPARTPLCLNCGQELSSLDAMPECPSCNPAAFASEAG